MYLLCIDRKEKRYHWSIRHLGKNTESWMRKKTFKNTQWRVTCLFFLFNNEHGKYQPCNKENKHRIITINTTSSIQLVRRIEHFDLKNVSVRKKVYSDHPNNGNNISLDHLLQRGLFIIKVRLHLVEFTFQAVFIILLLDLEECFTIFFLLAACGIQVSSHWKIRRVIAVKAITLFAEKW